MASPVDAAEIFPRAKAGDVVLEVKDLVKHFPITKGIVFRKTIGTVSAVDGVSFDLQAGETLGLVGESGCGKSTVAQLAHGVGAGRRRGRSRSYGVDMASMSKRQIDELRKRMQIILQDPYTSLEPADERRRHRGRAVRRSTSRGCRRRIAAPGCSSCMDVVGPRPARR